MNDKLLATVGQIVENVIFKMADHHHIGCWAPKNAPTPSGGTPWLNFNLIFIDDKSVKNLPYLSVVTELSQMTQLIGTRARLW